MACVTLSTPILLISEYCPNGDLLEFMRRRFPIVSAIVSRNRFLVLVLFDRRLNMLEHPDENSDVIITARKQLMFAVQIAHGLVR